MPTPPKESMGGNKPKHQVTAIEQAKSQYDYIVSLEDFTQSNDFGVLLTSEKDSINDEIIKQNEAYDILRQRVEEY